MDAAATTPPSPTLQIAQTLQLFDAVERGDVTGVRAALLQQSQSGMAVLVHPFDAARPTPLHRASARGHGAVVAVLLEHDGTEANAVMVNARDAAWGFTPLHKACDRGHAAVVRQLLRHQACDAAQVDDNRSTPLIWAAWRGHLEVVRELLWNTTPSGGAMPAWANGVGNTALHVACDEGRLEVVRELLTWWKSQPHDGGDDDVTSMLTARNDDQQTPLDCANRRQRGAVVHLLLQHYAHTTTLASLLREAQYMEDGTAKQVTSFVTKLPIGTLNAVQTHTLLELVLARDPRAIVTTGDDDDDDDLPLRTACRTGAPASVLDFLLRSYPDALLFL